MATIITLIIGVVQLYLLFKIWGELKFIAADPKARDDINTMISTLVQTYQPKEKKKIVAFKVKNNDPDDDS